MSIVPCKNDDNLARKELLTPDLRGTDTVRASSRLQLRVRATEEERERLALDLRGTHTAPADPLLSLLRALAMVEERERLARDLRDACGRFACAWPCPGGG